jgi:hypothetical protein
LLGFDVLEIRRMAVKDDSGGLIEVDRSQAGAAPRSVAQVKANNGL